MNSELVVYTDGSCYPKGRRGGAAFIFVTYDSRGEEAVEEFPLQGFKGSTNNEMELYACVKALSQIERDGWPLRARKILICTDSMYVVNSYKIALYQWANSKWRNREGRPVEHAALWREFVRLLKKCRGRVTLKWVKGHSKDKHNRSADKIAKKSAKGVLNPKPLHVTNVRRKKSPLRLQPGCVAMCGQTEKIRIVTDKLLKQKEYKYTYEIIEPASPDFQKVDIAYSKQLLSAGHEYEVIFNSNQPYPQIDVVVREFVKEGTNPETRPN
jgi:ribonuclease HI